MSARRHLDLLRRLKARTSGLKYVRALDDGGVDTGLAVYLMSSDTQMAADTTQAQSEILTTHNCSDGSSP